MKTIIAGSRSVIDYALVENACRNCGWTITEVVNGGARGVDRLGQLWAVNHRVPVRLFPANWKLHGIKAGMIRNREMALYADALIAIWDGMSHGTKHMIWQAEHARLRIFVVKV